MTRGFYNATYCNVLACNNVFKLVFDNFLLTSVSIGSSNPITRGRVASVSVAKTGARAKNDRRGEGRVHLPSPPFSSLLLPFSLSAPNFHVAKMPKMLRRRLQKRRQTSNWTTPLFSFFFFISIGQVLRNP